MPATIFDPGGCGCCVPCIPCCLPRANLCLSIDGGVGILLVFDEVTVTWTGGVYTLYTLACVDGNTVLTGGSTWTLVASTCDPFRLTFAGGGHIAVITPAIGDTCPTCDDGQICVTVTDCCTHAALSATVSVKSRSTGVTFGCTADGSGRCCVTVPGGDDYDVTASASGHAGSTVSTHHVGCGETVNVGKCLYPTATHINACCEFSVSGCGHPLDGANINVTGPESGGGATDATGKYTFCTGTLGTYSYTISKDRFVTATGSFAISGSPCGAGDTGVVAGLEVEDGYQCCFDCADPVPFEIHVSGPVSATLTYCPGTGYYIGLGSVTGPIADPSTFCNTSSTTGEVGVVLTVPCGGFGGLILSVSVMCGQLASTSFDPGHWRPGTGAVGDVPTCAYLFEHHCIAPIGCGGTGTITVSDCGPFSGTATVANGYGAGAAVNGTYTMSE